jgi:hypothetical protein
MLSSWFHNTANSKKKYGPEDEEEEDQCGIAWLEARPKLAELW